MTYSSVEKKEEKIREEKGKKTKIKIKLFTNIYSAVEEREREREREREKVRIDDDSWGERPLPMRIWTFKDAFRSFWDILWMCS